MLWLILRDTGHAAIGSQTDEKNVRNRETLTATSSDDSHISTTTTTTASTVSSNNNSNNSNPAQSDHYRDVAWGLNLTPNMCKNDSFPLLRLVTRTLLTLLSFLNAV